MNKGNTGLSLVAVLLAVLAAGLTWLFFISPRMTAMSEARDATVAAQEQNDLLELQLLALRRDAERLPEIREQIYGVRDYFPPSLDVPALRIGLERVFDDNDLVIIEEVIGDPVVIDPSTLSLTDAAAAVGLQSPTAELDFSGMLGTPVQIRTAGPLKNVQSLLNDFQRGDHPYMLVAQVGFTPVTERGEVSGVRVNPGDTEALITLMLFTLDAGDPSASVRPGSEAPDYSWDFPYDRGPSSDRNFFEPIPGR